MLIGILGNRGVGVFSIILSLLVFNIGIATSIYSLSFVTVSSSVTAIDSQDIQDENDLDDNSPLDEEEEERTPTSPVEEEEDEKSREEFSNWRLFELEHGSKVLVERNLKIPSRLKEVFTPPPEA